VDPSRAARGEVLVVGDQHERGAGLCAQAEQQVHHRIAGGLVQIAGRLVGEQQPRPWREGAGQCDALLFAAGQRPREMGQPISPTASRAARARAGHRAPRRVRAAR
jgi:hypothetical protein